MTRIYALLASLLLAAPALAHEVTAGYLQIIHPHIPQPAASAKAAGGFLSIINNGTEADRLLGIESDIAVKADVHQTKVDENGIGTMAPVDVIEIPPGGTVKLEHGGYHVMFMGLMGTLTEGELRKATLIFERAGRVEIEFQIDPPTGQGNHDGMNHSSHGSGG